MGTIDLELIGILLEDWKKIYEGGGEVRPEDTTFLGRNSCRLIGENCKSFDHWQMHLL